MHLGRSPGPQMQKHSGCVPGGGQGDAQFFCIGRRWAGGKLCVSRLWEAEYKAKVGVTVGTPTLDGRRRRKEEQGQIGNEDETSEGVDDEVELKALNPTTHDDNRLRVLTQTGEKVAVKDNDIDDDDNRCTGTASNGNLEPEFHVLNLRGGAGGQRGPRVLFSYQ